MADTKTQFKLNKLAKDLGLKGKDLIEILSNHGKEVTAQKTLDASEFDILFETVTRENQIDDVGAYLDGKTYIPSKKKPAKAEKPTEEVKAQEEAPAPQVSAPAAEVDRSTETPAIFSDHCLSVRIHMLSLAAQVTLLASVTVLP